MCRNRTEGLRAPLIFGAEHQRGVLRIPNIVLRHHRSSLRPGDAQQSAIASNEQGFLSPARQSALNIAGRMRGGEFLDRSASPIDQHQAAAGGTAVDEGHADMTREIRAACQRLLAEND